MNQIVLFCTVLYQASNFTETRKVPILSLGASDCLSKSSIVEPSQISVNLKQLGPVALKLSLYTFKKQTKVCFRGNTFTGWIMIRVGIFLNAHKNIQLERVRYIGLDSNRLRFVFV